MKYLLNCHLVVFEGEGVLFEDEDDDPPDGGAEEPNPELQLLPPPTIEPDEPGPSFFFVGNTAVNCCWLIS